jgi:hypothetical protein
MELEFLAEIEMLKTLREGMVAENAICVYMGERPKYDEQSFSNVANKMQEALASYMRARGC